MKSKNLIIILVGTALILLIPLLAKWPWSLGDFVIMGILIFGTGLALDWVARKVDKRYRVITGAGVILAFLLIWTQLAVQLVSKLFTGNF